MTLPIWIDGGVYQKGQKIKFDYLYGPTDRPSLKRIVGVIQSDFYTVSGDYYIQLVDNCPDLCGIFNVNLIVSNSCQNEI